MVERDHLKLVQSVRWATQRCDALDMDEQLTATVEHLAQAPGVPEMRIRTDIPVSKFLVAGNPVVTLGFNQPR